MIGELRGSTDSLEADVCIVGGGATGLNLAAALEGTSLKVIVLEAGGRNESPGSRSFNEGESATVGHPPADHFRVRALGGTSRAWGGCCVPLDPVDFTRRDWVAHSGWPIGLEDLAPHYEAALQAAEAAVLDPPLHQPSIPAIEGGEFSTVVEHYSRPTDFAKRFKRLLTRSANSRVVLNADVVEIAMTANGRATDHLVVAAPDGSRSRVRARAFVIAAGGLEAARLLLCGGPDHSNGLGNEHGWVGEGYMCHVAGIAGWVTLREGNRAAIHYERDRGGAYLGRRLVLSAEAQKRRRLLNLAFRLRRANVGDASHGSAVLSALHLRNRLRSDRYTDDYWCDSTELGLSGHLRNIAREPHQLAVFAGRFLAEQTLRRRPPPAVVFPAPRNSYALEFNGEQAPSRESRITLGSSQDRYGRRRLRIGWKLDPLDIETVQTGVRVLSEELERTGAGRVEYSPELIEQRLRAGGAFGGHHIGATRMSERPEDGVVDRNCRVHSIDNLYVVGPPVMPTSGHANPTLTGVALAYRLADHLRQGLS